MSGDVLFLYRYPITTFDTATRFPPSVGSVAADTDDILLRDGSSFLLLVDNSTLTQLGH